MQVTFGKILKDKNEWDNENILCPKKEYNRDKYWNLRLFIRTLSFLPICFLSGYYIFYNVNAIHDVEIIVARFILIFIMSFILLQFPNTLIHCLLYPSPFKNNDLSLKFLYRKRILSYSSTTAISSARYNLMIIIPLILFLWPPILYLVITTSIDMDVLAYTAAASILLSEEILNYFLQFSSYNNGLITLYEPINYYERPIKINENTINTTAK